MAFTFRIALLSVCLVCVVSSSLSAAIPVSGRVTADGEPAAGARVVLLAEVGAVAAGEILLSANLQSEVLAETRSDADGLFRLQAKAIGFFKVEVELERRVPMELSLQPLLHGLELPVVELPVVVARLIAFATSPVRNRMVGQTVRLGRSGTSQRVAA